MWVQRNAPPPIFQMVELAYLLRARLGEVLALTVKDVSESHVRLVRTKGSEGELTIVSDRLRAALEPARGGTHICHQYTEHGFRSAWARLKRRWSRTASNRSIFTTSKRLAYQITRLITQATGAPRCGGLMCGPFRRFLRRDSLGHRIPLIGLALPVIGVRPAVAVRPLVVTCGLVSPPAEVDVAYPW